LWKNPQTQVSALGGRIAMARRAVVFVTLLACACAAVGDEKDPVKEKLFAAKVAYDKEMREFRGQVDDWLDKREAAARKVGNLKAVEQIKAERKAFEEDGEWPKDAPPALVQKQEKAKKALDAAYAEAVKAYTKAKKDDLAAAVEKEWKGGGTAGAGATTKEKAIDLLALVNVKEHAVRGEWKMSGKALVIANGTKNATLHLPYEPGEEYDVEVKCRREGYDGFGLGLVAGGRQVRAVFDGWPQRGYVCGLDVVDNKRTFDNVTTAKGELLKADKDHTLLCSVRSGNIDISVNGKVVSSFKGDFDRFSLDDPSRVPNEKVLFLFVPPGTAFRFDRVAVTPVKGKGKILK
jgi:hypothetical protein